MTDFKVIAVIGTRKRDSHADFLAVERAFLKIYEPGDVIVSGLCPQGGDRFAVELQELYKLDYIWFPANWKVFHRAAGFVRNSYIAKCSDYIVACLPDGRWLGGTADTLKKFLKLHGEEAQNRIIIV